VLVARDAEIERLAARVQLLELREEDGRGGRGCEAEAARGTEESTLMK